MTKEKLNHTAFLERLLALEVKATEERRLRGRLRFASLPASWRLEDFDFYAQPSVDRQLVIALAILRFVSEAANVLLVGRPGVGKTMLATCWPGSLPRPVTGSTSPPPPTSSPTVTRPPSRVVGRPPCAFTPGLPFS